MQIFVVQFLKSFTKVMFKRNTRKNHNATLVISSGVLITVYGKIVISKVYEEVINVFKYIRIYK